MLWSSASVLQKILHEDKCSEYCQCSDLNHHWWTILARILWADLKRESGYHVISKDGEVGTLTNCPVVDEVFVLAGRSWQVVSIDEERKIIYVARIKSNRIPAWAGTGGDIHDKVVKRMKKVLQEDTIYTYLQPNAQRLLSNARKHAKENELLDRKVLPCSRSSFFICPWCGTREIKTIANLFSHGLKKALDIYTVISAPHYLQITTGLSLSIKAGCAVFPAGCLENGCAQEH